MKALICHDINKYLMEERPTPIIRKSSDTIVRILGTNICRKDFQKKDRSNGSSFSEKKPGFQFGKNENLATALNIANNELVQFAFIASHNLQEPLCDVSNYMQIFEEDYKGQLDNKARNYLHSVKMATKKMSALIKSLLSFTKLGHNINFTYSDCNDIINDVLVDLGSLIKTSKAIIKVAEMPQLYASEILLRQLFQNLISNAIKFQKKDTQAIIEIYSEKAKGVWHFSVSDNGIGIAPAHFKKIFDIFQRLHSNEDEYEGSGIGLANSKKIIQLHHGKIWVESNIGQGTTFHFTIPELTL